MANSAQSTPTFQAVANNIKGSTTGTAPAAGYIGEAIGTAIAGTGAKTYLTESTTAFGGATILTKTLNKGVYLVNVTCYATAAAQSNFYISAYLGAVSLVEPFSRATCQAGGYTTLSMAFPLIVDTDGVVLNILGTGSPSSAANRMSIVRIA